MEETEVDAAARTEEQAEFAAFAASVRRSVLAPEHRTESEKQTEGIGWAVCQDAGRCSALNCCFGCRLALAEQVLGATC